MNQRLTRRRFGRLAIAGTAAVGLSYLANKTEAQTPNLGVVGVRLGPITSTSDAAITEVEVDSTELNSTTAASAELNSTTAASTARSVDVLSLDVVTGKEQTLTTPQDLQDGTKPILPSGKQVNGTIPIPIVQFGEQVTDLTYLSDGTLVLAITPVSTSKNGGTPTRLIFLGTSPTTVTVSGLKKQQKLESLVGTNQGGLIGLVVQKNGTPPVRLVDIDVKTGQISFTEKVILASGQRFSNLVQCPDGKLYTTALGKKGETSLVQLDLGQQKPITVAQLRFNGRAWNNGLQSLVCSAAGQLLGFGALRYETPNHLHIVNAKTGTMTRLTAFDVAKITIAPT